jgi:hypothetical protein
MIESDEININLSASQTNSPVKNTHRKIRKKENFLVEEILEKKKMNNQWMYLIKWEGFPFDQSTWEPRENIENLGDYLEEFDTKWEDLHRNMNKLKSTPQSRKKPKKVAKKVVRKDSSFSEQDFKKDDSLNFKDKIRVKNTDIVKNSDLFKEMKITSPKISSKELISKSPSYDKRSNDSKKITSWKSRKDKEIKVSKISPRKRIKTVSNKATNHISIINNIRNVGEDKKEISKSYGSLEIDTPEDILDFKVDDFGTISFLISWKQRNGSKVIPSYVYDYDLEKDYSQLLNEYYRKAFIQYAMIKNIVSKPVSYNF